MLGPNGEQLFQSFGSPDHETSILKDVPVQCLDLVKPVMRQIEELTGRRLRVIYRGPRARHHGQSTTWKQDAERFAVYFR